MGNKVHHRRSFFGSLFPPLPHDYLLRRRRFRTITNVVLIALFSLLVAGMIIYTSNPGSFAAGGR